MLSPRVRQTASVAELQDYDAAFDRCFGMVAFQMNRHIIDHLLRTGRQLTDDDLEAMVIWGVLAHQNVAHLLPPGSHPCSVLDERGRARTPHALQALRLRDVAQITRIPRETVRRKLEKLAAAGWIQRQADGWVIRSDHTADQLREFTRDNVRRFLAAADEVLRTLREADAEIAAARLAAPSVGGRRAGPAASDSAPMSAPT